MASLSPGEMCELGPRRQIHIVSNVMIKPAESGHWKLEIGCARTLRVRQGKRAAKSRGALESHVSSEFKVEGC